MKCLNISDKEIKELLKTIKSEAALAKILDKLGDKASKEDVIDEYKKLKKKEIQDSAFERQYVFFKRRIAKLTSDLKKLDKDDPTYDTRKVALEKLTDEFTEAWQNQNQELFLKIGESTLANIESTLNKIERGEINADPEYIVYIIDAIESWDDFKGLRNTTKDLTERIYPFISEQVLKLVNEYSTENFDITQDLINAQDTDIGTFTKNWGALADSENYLVRTIGSIIKAVHNRISAKNKTLAKSIKEKVDGLEQWGKENGMKLDDVYNMFIQENEEDIVLTSKYIIKPNKEGKGAILNPNYQTIIDNKPLYDFYKFYQSLISSSSNELPIKVGKNFIPNIHHNSTLDKLKGLIKVKTVSEDDLVKNEELFSDVVPTKFTSKISKDKKSRDLGDSLLQFASYANQYSEMSSALPTVRLLQSQLKFKMTDNSLFTTRKFKTKSDPSKSVIGEKSRLYEQVDTIINMQLKGEMSKKEGGVTISNKDGKKKIIFFSDIIDLFLKYNSLLRIGLSPITAASNVVFGETANIGEAVGGRYFGMKDLFHATNIFNSQVDIISSKEDSVLYEVLRKLNPLMELDDYNLSDDIKLKRKMSVEKLEEYMYSLQKKGELFLQSRTMLAVMIHDDLMTSDGKLTQKYKDLSQRELEELTDKIQRINQMIHGRYTQREAAAAQQHFYWRAAMQFRKWIPAAIENRIGSRKYDNRLKDMVEGRYVTVANIIKNDWRNPATMFENLLLPIINAKAALRKGNLTELEIYNMRKTAIELITLGAMLLMYASLHGGDDDDDKKFRKNALVKTSLTLLNRAAGDILFFYSPNQMNELVRNAAPIAKTMHDVYTAFKAIPYAFYVGEDWDYEHGSREGDNKFWSQAERLTPIVKLYPDLKRMLNNKALEELN